LAYSAWASAILLRWFKPKFLGSKVTLSCLFFILRHAFSFTTKIEIETAQIIPGYWIVLFGCPE